jgi:hypothetical protein
MKTRLRSTLFLVAALLVAGVVVRQEVEIHRLRTAMAGITKETTAVSTAPLPADIEELRRELAEVGSLRAEVVRLHREAAAVRALQVSVENLAAEVSAISGASSGRSDAISSMDDVNGAAGDGSHLVLQANALAQSSPEEAAQWVASLRPGKEQDEAALIVLDHWIDSDPAAAGNWTTQFAEGPFRDHAMSRVARHWTLRDWNGAAAWLRTLPAGSSRDAAIGAFVISADGYDIRLALEWANAMEDPKNRTQRVEATARRWLREDKPAARAWIQKAQLPAGIAERLLSNE